MDWSDARRLHPFSWLFILIAQLKQFALPLLVLLFTGRSNAYEWWGLVGVGVLALVSLAQYFTYRYRIGEHGIMIRSGLLQRTVRDIPFSKIQNIGLHQNLLHRIFDVAEVKLESGGGAKMEGQMRVVGLRDAHALESLIRDQRAVARAVDAEGNAQASPQGETLHALSTMEIVRLGLIDNRGMLLLAAAFGALAQTGETFGDLIEGSGRWLFGQYESLHLGLWPSIVGATLLLLIGLLAMRALSVALALLQFHGFELRRDGRQISIERGLLSRSRGHLPRHRLQAFDLRESWLHRRFGRRSLQADSATLEAANESRSMRDVVPLATPQRMDELVTELLVGARWPLRDWRPLHPNAWRRIFFWRALALLVGCAIAGWFQPWALLGLALLPLLVWLSVMDARHSAFALEDGLLSWREGWLNRRWRWIEVRKIQGVEFRQSPFDHRHDMARLRVDSCGASPFAGDFELRFLREEDARVLFSALQAQMD